MDRFGALLRAAADGDDLAWREIYLRHRHMMALAVDRAGMSPELRQRLDSEDVMQRALMRAHRELPDALPLEPEAFTSWLFLITLRTLEDLVRHHHRAGRSLRREIRGLADPAPTDSAPGPSERAAGKESRLRVLHAVAQLAKDEQRIVLWRVVEGHSLREIGEAFGISGDQAGARLAKILSRLRRMLGDA